MPRFANDEIAATPAIAAEPVKKDLLLEFEIFFIFSDSKLSLLKIVYAF
jgi:hypothetical protein